MRESFFLSFSFFFWRGGGGGGGGRVGLNGKEEEESEEERRGKMLIGAAGWNCYLSYVNSQGGKEKIVDVYDKEE